MDGSTTLEMYRSNQRRIGGSVATTKTWEDVRWIPSSLVLWEVPVLRSSGCVEINRLNHHNISPGVSCLCKSHDLNFFFITGRRRDGTKEYGRRRQLMTDVALLGSRDLTYSSGNSNQKGIHTQTPTKKRCAMQKERKGRKLCRSLDLLDWNHKFVFYKHTQKAASYLPVVKIATHNIACVFQLRAFRSHRTVCGYTSYQAGFRYHSSWHWRCLSVPLACMAPYAVTSSMYTRKLWELYQNEDDVLSFVWHRVHRSGKLCGKLALALGIGYSLPLSPSLGRCIE